MMTTTETKTVLGGKVFVRESAVRHAQGTTVLAIAIGLASTDTVLATYDVTFYRGEVRGISRTDEEKHNPSKGVPLAVYKALEESMRAHSLVDRS